MAPPPLAERQELAGAGRIVVKIGSSSLTTRGLGIDEERLDALADALIRRREAGGELVLVSSGAIAAALAPLGLTCRPRDLATQQAAASVGQGLLLARYTAAFSARGVAVGQILLSADDLVRRTHYANARRTLFKLLGLGVLPIVNENDTVATHEIRFGDNDRLAALVAHLVQADALVLLSDVDGLYDRPPSRDGARRIPEVADPGDLDAVRIGKVGAAGVGRGGMTTKIEAAMLATTAGIPVLLASADQADQALSGGDVGTWFHALGGRTASRLSWLAHMARPSGRLLLDPGAVAAVVDRRMSLLPAGITGVGGTFCAGDVVDLVAPGGEPVARGLVNFDSAELPALLGRTTHELSRELGDGYSREVVHRDDLAVLTSGRVGRRQRGRR